MGTPRLRGGDMLRIATGRFRRDYAAPGAAPAHDFDDRARDAQPDIGAYEYAPGQPTLTPSTTPTASPTRTPAASVAQTPATAATTTATTAATTAARQIDLPLILRVATQTSPPTRTPAPSATATQTATPSPTPTPTATALASGAATLTTLGDSLTEGDGDDSGRGGFPGRLLPLLQARRPGSAVTNLGHSGWDSEMLIDGYEGQPSQLDTAATLLAQAVASGRAPLATVWIGSNDLWYLYINDGETPVEEEQQNLQHFTANIGLILSQLRGAGATVFIALLDDQSLRPVAADPAQRAAAFPGITAGEVLRMSQQVARYNAAIVAQAAQHGAVTVDFYHTTIFTEPATLSDDGNHPNTAGYDAITELWFDAISPSLP